MRQALRTTHPDANWLSGKFVIEAAILAAGMLGTPEAACGRLPPTAVWLESGLSTRRFIVAMIVS